MIGIYITAIKDDNVRLDPAFPKGLAFPLISRTQVIKATPIHDFNRKS